ncbi:MAG TPA: peptidoglycan DD-metalloendopeptidase family protein [Anaeromyxobacteraceae bacterium]|nr:peptidoglycan DD-metalloendopeptidase family protein [Anaeromyxobacteraceae bacterium]
MRAALLAIALASDPRAQLEALEARRAAEREVAALLARRERSVLDALDEVERAWRAAESEARAADVRRAESAARLERAVREEAEADARYTALIGELRPRLVAIDRISQAGELRLLATATSLDDLVRRRALLERVFARDGETLRAARSALQERGKATAERRAEADRLGGLAAEAEAGRTEAAARRAARVALLASIRGARELHERAAAEAEGQGKKLAEFVAALPPPRSGEVPYRGFGQLRGKLPGPAVGRIEVGFGRVVNPRFHTVTVQNGVDIAALRGEAVRAVAPGRVVHAGWFRGYGNLVIVDHGDGFHTLVAHLESMTAAAGEDVEAGSLLGTVGDTGSLKGAYLYFELREHGRPVDPASWLAP